MDKLNNMWNKLNNIAVAPSRGTGLSEYIPKLESLVGSSLPSDFKDFLLNFGGYEIVPPDSLDRSYMIKLPKLKGGRESIYLSHSTNIRGMISACNEWGSSLPPKSILIEATGDGSNIFMSMTPGSIGEIYFIERDHYMDYGEFDDYEFEEHACDAFDPKNGVVPNIFSKLANSFSDFIMVVELDDGE
ncbi:SMI1/KNR4 family protein [Pseudoalteromonas sp. SWXJZ94C]|uniref:SMI1/KNR4 family protein n=1 Tax=Pseudoalteromonas sp. SWXJZ94C TaxID=2792065 RepID=UPI0018CE736B|nr:SMI1/KNR4 family protein [Pseudoalteromonas sp. SWXJZ94C]MBH0055420.1 SMI1/KNR4 family protein [Pseudoalteromonas sp. SWXJZ94C]